jgi:hypothetical protein
LPEAVWRPSGYLPCSPVWFLQIEVKKFCLINFVATKFIKVVGGERVLFFYANKDERNVVE